MLTERGDPLGRDELGRLGDYVNERAVAHDSDCQWPSDRLAEHQLLQILGPGDGGAACRDQQVPGPQAGLAAGPFGTTSATRRPLARPKRARSSPGRGAGTLTMPR